MSSQCEFRLCVCLSVCLSVCLFVMDRPLTVNHFRLLFCTFCVMRQFKTHSRVEDMNHGHLSNKQPEPMFILKCNIVHNLVQLHNMKP